MKLGNNIQFLRNNMCLSQEELATDDIPANETDDISAIISRYLLGVSQSLCKPPN